VSAETEKPKLTADEQAMAKRFGMTPEEYAAFKSPSPDLDELIKPGDLGLRPTAA
jgi:hypothetical protein